MLQNQVDEIRALLAAKLRARGQTLDAQLRKAGRQLPRRLRREAKVVVDAMTVAENPKLARMNDDLATRKAAQNLINFLKTIDPADRLKGRILGILGTISAVLIVTFIVVVYVLVKRGLL